MELAFPGWRGVHRAGGDAGAGAPEGPDQDAIVDDVREVAVQPQCDSATGQGLADTDVPPGEPDQP